MKIILTENVRTLGTIGEIVNVSPGYARNFLFPKKFAVLADEANSKVIEDQKRRLKRKIEAHQKEATEIKGKLDGLCLEIVKKVGGNGKLFGSVTTTEISKLLHDSHKLDVEKRILHLEKPIKSLGTFDVKAKLCTGVESEFQVKVSMDPQQAKELAAQAKKKKESKKKAPQEEEKTKEEKVPEGEEVSS